METLKLLAKMKLFSVEYEYQDRVWSTVVGGINRENAKQQFRHENPHVRLTKIVEGTNVK